MSAKLKILWLETKASSPTTIWLFPFLSLIACLVMVDNQSDFVVRLEQVSMILEILFPLAVMFVSTGFVLNEGEKKSLEFIGVRSSLVVFWIRKSIMIFTWSTFWVGILTLVYHNFYVSLPVGQMIFSFLATSLVLVSTSTMVALFLKDAGAGYLFGTFWWGFCLIARRFAFDILGVHLYLFYWWFSVKESLVPERWLENKSALVAAAMFFALLTVLLLRARERLF